MKRANLLLGLIVLVLASVVAARNGWLPRWSPLSCEAAPADTIVAACSAIIQSDEATTEEIMKAFRTRAGVYARTGRDWYATRDRELADRLQRQLGHGAGG
jgi:hypothetical protein